MFVICTITAFRTLLNIGFWPVASREQKDKVVYHLNARCKNELALFEELDQQVLEWVNHFYNEMIDRKAIDRKTMEQKHTHVKADTIKHKEARETTAQNSHDTIIHIKDVWNQK